MSGRLFSPWLIEGAWMVLSLVILAHASPPYLVFGIGVAALILLWSRSEDIPLSDWATIIMIVALWPATLAFLAALVILSLLIGAAPDGAP